MPVFNYARRELNAKIVYYGPGLSGKTTNLQYVHAHVRPENRGKLVSVATQTDRTLFFDFLPLDLGVISGYTVRLHLYTVPGQVHYNATRKLVLKGVDGVVFVADSQRAMSDANLESYINLERNLASYGKDLKTLPHVIQANKRDLPDVMTLEQLGSLLNRHGASMKGASAASGAGVQETLSEIVRLVISDLRGQFRADERGAAPSSPATETGSSPDGDVAGDEPREAAREEEPSTMTATGRGNADVRITEIGSTLQTIAHPDGVERADGVLEPGRSVRRRFTLKLPSGDEAELAVEISYRAPAGAAVPCVEVRIHGGGAVVEGDRAESD